jgi:hypothetical protein
MEQVREVVQQVQEMEEDKVEEELLGKEQEEKLAVELVIVKTVKVLRDCFTQSLT